MSQIIVTGLLSTLGAVVLSLVAWVTGRAIQRATTRRTDAEADKTIGEAWGLVTAEWRQQIEGLRDDVNRANTRAEHAEQTADRCQARVVQLEAVMRQHDIPIPDPEQVIPT